MAGNAPARKSYCPPEYRTRIHAITDLIRWGPSVFSHAEFLLLLYYSERTLVYGKQADASSLSQITEGIFSRKNNEWIRGPVGLSATAVKTANNALSQKGLLLRRHALPGEARYKPDRGNQATEYEINWTALHAEFEKRRRAPLGHVVTKPLGHKTAKPLGHKVPNNRGKSSSEGNIHRESSSEDRSGVEEVPGSLRKRADSQQERTEQNQERPPDDAETARAQQTFPSPKMELAHLCKQRGQLLSEHEWRQISEQAELHGIDLGELVAFVRPHLINPKTRNPLGMVKSKLKSYRAMNRPPSASEPVPATASTEKCPLCGDRKGQGTRLEENKFVPCECATEEWRARLEKVNQQAQERSGRLLGSGGDGPSH